MTKPSTRLHVESHRIGQERAVTCLRLIAADTIEEVIADALERKAGIARVLLGDSDPVGTSRKALARAGARDAVHEQAANRGGSLPELDRV
jgi:hypothetical protein